ncbi:MAG: hypothetical protein HYZ42_00660 [Bacteroidetes bacterium]|nr:hypothetical protein [Bacteroidota bacterium]
MRRIYNNTITGFVRNSSSTGSIAGGIVLSASASTSVDSIYNNSINNWTSIGTATNTYGIFNSGTSLYNYTYNDSVYNITGGATFVGITVISSTANNSAIVRKNYVNISSSGTTATNLAYNLSSSVGTTNSFTVDSNYSSYTYTTATTGALTGINVSNTPFTLNINNNTFGSMLLGSASTTGTGAFNFITVPSVNSNSGSITNIFNHTLSGFIRKQSTSSTGTFAGISLTGGGLTVNVYNNIITNDTNPGTSDFNGIIISAANATLRRVYNNQVTNVSRTAVLSNTYGIQMTGGATAGTDSIYNNTIKNWGTVGTNSTIGIIHSTGTSISNTFMYKDSVYNIDFNGTGTGIQNLNTGNNNAIIRKNYVSLRHVGTTSQLAGITYSGASTSSVYTIDSNYITGSYNSNTTGNFYALNNQTSLPWTTNIVANTITGCSIGNGASAATGEFRGIYTQASNANTGSALNIYGNTISSFSRSQSVLGAGLFYGMSFGGTTGCITDKIYNNTITGIANPTTGNMIGIYSSSSLASKTGRNIYSNLVNNFSRITSSTAGTVAGVLVDAGGASVNDSNYSNVVKNFTNIGNSTFYGVGYSSTASNKRIYLDSVYNISSSGVLYGYYVSAVTNTATVNRNVVFDLTTLATATNSVNGIYINSGTAINVTNNRVADLKAPSLAGVGVYGIYVNGGTLVRTLNNTVYLNASSTGIPFTTYALYVNTAATLDLRNNILVNNSTPSSNGFAVTYGRSSTTLSTYKDSSDNNIYYAGTPSTTNLLYYDITNSIQTISSLRTFMHVLNGTNRDRFSYTENPTFLSTSGLSSNFLKLDSTVSTYAEGGGQTVSFITNDDIDAGSIRTGYPLGGQVNGGGAQFDIGADEFDGTPKTAMSYSTTNTDHPTFLGTAKGQRNQKILRTEIVMSGIYNPQSITNFTLNANNSDNIADIDSALIYYTGSSNAFDTFALVGSADPTLINYSISPNFKLQQGSNYFWLVYHINNAATTGDSIDAELVDHTINGSTTTLNAAPQYGREIKGPMCGNYKVGVSGLADWATITDASTELLLRGVDTTCTLGVNLLLIDTNYSTSETFPIVFDTIVGAAEGGRRITLKPDAGVTSTIIGANNHSLIQFKGTRYFTLSGNNGNGNKSLTINNYNPTPVITPLGNFVNSQYTMATVSLVSYGTGLGTKYLNINNCKIICRR